MYTDRTESRMTQKMTSKKKNVVRMIPCLYVTYCLYTYRVLFHTVYTLRNSKHISILRNTTE